MTFAGLQGNCLLGMSLSSAAALFRRAVRRVALDLDGTKAVGLDARMIDLAASALIHLAKTVGAHAFQRTKASQVLAAVPSAPTPSAARKARGALTKSFAPSLPEHSRSQSQGTRPRRPLCCDA